MTSRAPSHTDVAATLRLAITRTARRLRQEAGTGPGPALTAALATVDRHGPLTPSELAAIERIQRPTATRLLARLEADDLLTRTADPTDRRASLITATPAGRALLRTLRTRKTAYLARRLDGLEPDELDTLARAAAILDRLLEAPEEAAR